MKAPHVRSVHRSVSRGKKWCSWRNVVGALGVLVVFARRGIVDSHIQF